MQSIRLNQEHLWTLERNLDAEPACLRLLDEVQAGHNSMRNLSDKQPCTVSLEVTP